MSGAAIVVRFSTCAPPTMWERIKNLSPKDASRCICRMTRSKFSHVDLKVSYKGQEVLLGASDNPEAPVIGSGSNPRGVALRPINYQRFAIRRDAVMHTTPKIKRDFEHFCFDQIGKPFDTEAIQIKTYLSANFERDWRLDFKWFCAEMLCAASERSKFMGYEFPGLKPSVSSASLLLYWAPKINFEQFWKPIPHLTPAGPWEE